MEFCSTGKDKTEITSHWNWEEEGSFYLLIQVKLFGEVLEKSGYLDITLVTLYFYSFSFNS